MNLRKVDYYDIGLDIGTNSVGWAVTDKNGNLCHSKGKATWGSRLFPSAETAAGTRMKRGQRRRYDRRRQRLNLLQGFFASEIEKVDPDFFIRLNQSRLWKEDRDPSYSQYRWPLFNGIDFNESDYYKQFPTIYHLRSWLTRAEEKVDIRLIYLAFHNIVKHRGNFLYQENKKLSSKNANMKESIERLCEALIEWCQLYEIECSPKPRLIEGVFRDVNQGPSSIRESIAPLFGFDKDYKKLASLISKAIVGQKVEFADVFFIEKNESNFYLSEDEKAEAFLSVCPDEGQELFQAMQAVYSSYVLMGILKESDGDSISFCKVREYERYGENLRTLKALVREYVPSEYRSFFQGDFYNDKKSYDASKAKGYTRYNMGVKKFSYDDFKAEVKRLFEGTGAESDARYQAMQISFDEGTFLKRLKTSENGVIPYQLHLEEMTAIMAKQSKHYDFLKIEKEKIESLVTFRIPYYVGPLTQKNAAKNDSGSTRFAWSLRKEGKENERIYPWNWDQVIDKDASAEAFIRRMTGTCTYLQGEPVMPRCSLMYEMYCVLNELNGAKITFDGDKAKRFSADDRIDIVDDLFKKRKTISYKDIETWYKKKHGPSVATPHVSGGQGEKGFESKLSSYNDFCAILGVEEIDRSDMAMVEEIILWNTLFEDRSILKQRIKNVYGERLGDEQIKLI